MSKSLYTTQDVKEVREKLYEDQKGIDPITGLEIPANQKVLDHDHKTQYVRAVLHRQTNAVLGKIENLWTRYLGYWYTGTLSEFLRGCADYIEKEHPQEYVHPKWIKKVQTEFNKLNSAEKCRVLLKLGAENGKNDVERKENFKKLLTKKVNLGYDVVMNTIKEVKSGI